MNEGRDDLAAVRTLKIQRDALSAEVTRLKHGGGGPTLPPMGEIDAKIAASEARTDVKFATVGGKLELIVAELRAIKDQSVDARAESRGTRRTVIATGLSLAALILGLLAFGASSFGIGTRIGDIARTEAQHQLALNPPVSNAAHPAFEVPIDKSVPSAVKQSR